MTDEQFEQVKKRVNSQMKTANRWVKEMLPEETFIYLRGVDGILGAHWTKGTSKNTLEMLGRYLHSLADDIGVSYSTLLSLITLLSDDNISFSVESVGKKAKKE